MRRQTMSKTTAHFEPEDLSPGAVFFRNDTQLPSWFRFGYEECEGWKRLVDANSLALERTVIAAGWHYAFIASAVVCSAVGMTGHDAQRRALRKVMARMNGTGFNSFEIAEWKVGNYLALRTVRLAISPRHLSPDPILKKTELYSYPGVSKAAQAIFWRASDVQPQAKGM
jgi:hypothetical protein